MRLDSFISFDSSLRRTFTISIHPSKILVSGIQTTSFGVEALRSRLRKMNDAELLRFGQDAKFMCSPIANMGKAPREEFAIQLREARAEWRRRFPKIPLSESV